MKRASILFVFIASLGMFGGCGSRIKQCTSSKKYNPGFRLEVRVHGSNAVQVVTVPPDGVVTVEIPSNKDCNGVVLTPLPEAAVPQQTP